jgi:hypothetical protein
VGIERESPQFKKTLKNINNWAKPGVRNKKFIWA